jgi:hypothetical protein
MTQEVISRIYYLNQNGTRLNFIIIIVLKQIKLNQIVLLNVNHLMVKNAIFLRLAKTQDNLGPKPNYACQWGQSL